MDGIRLAKDDMSLRNLHVKDRCSCKCLLFTGLDLANQTVPVLDLGNRPAELPSLGRELRIDSRFAERHSPLYRLMLGSGAEISESKRDVMAAEGGSGNFLQDLEDRRRYAPLHELLSGRPPEAVVGAICALGALTK